MGTRKHPNKYVKGEQVRMYKSTNKNSPVIKCDICGNEFRQSIKQLDYIEEQKIEVLGFKCPKCKKLYIAYVLDNTLRKNMNKASELKLEYKKLNKLKDNAFSDSIRNHGFVLPAIKERWLKKLPAVHEDYMKLVEDNKKRGARLKAIYIKKMSQVKEE